MRLDVIWSPQALAALQRIHWRTASAIDAAIIGHAAVMAERPGPPLARQRLRVAGHDALLVVDREVAALRVLALYRAV